MKLTSLDRLVQSNRLVIKQVVAKQTTDEELRWEQLRRIDEELTQVGHKLDAQEIVTKVRKPQEPAPNLQTIDWLFSLSVTNQRYRQPMAVRWPAN